MKRKKIILIFLIALIIIFFNSGQLLATSKVIAATSGDYTIKKYDVNIDVNENNTLDITEVISVKYNTDDHVFIRKIPLKNTIVDNEKKIANKANVNNLIIGQEYSLTRESGYEVIKIKEDVPSPTNKTYTIKYTYDLGEDKFPAKDKLYYNLIGDNRDCVIENLNIQINMPKAFENRNVNLYVETENAKEPESVNYTIKDNTIFANYKRHIYRNQNFIIDIDLENKYFVGTNKNIDVLSLIVMVISAAFVLVADRLWTKYGRNKFVAEIIDSTPPEELNSAEASYILKGFINDKSVMSLLLNLANNGYIRIENVVSKDANSNEKKSKISIVRLKKYDGDNEFEKIFMENIFPKNLEKNTISYKELFKKFYGVSEIIKNKFDSKENKNKIFEPGVIEKSNILVVMAGTIFGLINIKPTIEYMGEIPILVYSLFHIVALWVALKSLYKREFLDKVLNIMLAIGFEMVVWSNVTLPILQEEPVYFISSIIGMVSIITLAVFTRLFTRRTKFGNEMLGRVKGFKEFIENVNDEEIKKLCKIDPNYYFNVFPYAYSIGIEKKLMAKFEKIDIDQPEWFVTNEAFTIHSFNEFINSNFKFNGIITSK